MRPSKRSVIAVLLIAMVYLIAGWIEVHAEEAKVVVIPEKSKEILIITEGDTHILVDLDTNKTRICASTDGTIIICTD